MGEVISADGRYVAFQSTADNLVVGDTNGHSNVFVKDFADRRVRRFYWLGFGPYCLFDSKQHCWQLGSPTGRRIMMKRPILAESMKSVQPGSPAPRAPKPGDAARPEGSYYFAATRAGLKRTVAVAPEEHKRLKRLSADTGRSIEDLMREALADLFVKLGSAHPG